MKVQTFTRMDVKPELDLEDQQVEPQVEVLEEPTAPADQGRQSQPPKEPTTVFKRRPKTKSKPTPQTQPSQRYTLGNEPPETLVEPQTQPEMAGTSSQTISEALPI